MFDNITLGQYYPMDSAVHKLDPRCKIVLLVAFVTAIFLAQNLFAYIPVALFICLAAAMSKLPIKLLLRGLKPLRFLLIFTFLLNLFFQAGQTPLLNLGFATITREALISSIHFSLRLILLVTGSSLLTLTTTPVSMTDGMERLLSPLKIIKFPAHEMAMMMTIALRFIPTLLEEADKIMKAQTARGAGFDSGGLITRARAMVPLLVPLFVSAFRSAGDLAMAMEARCYHGGEGRTRLRVLKLTRRDLYASLITALLISTVVLMGRL